MMVKIKKSVGPQEVQQGFLAFMGNAQFYEGMKVEWVNGIDMTPNAFIHQTDFGLAYFKNKKLSEKKEKRTTCLMSR